jgi:hypothetical protein
MLVSVVASQLATAEVGAVAPPGAGFDEEQFEQYLERAAPQLAKIAESPRFWAGVPAEFHAPFEEFFARVRTRAGRAELAAQERAVLEDPAFWEAVDSAEDPFAGAGADDEPEPAPGAQSGGGHDPAGDDEPPPGGGGNPASPPSGGSGGSGGTGGGGGTPSSTGPAPTQHDPDAGPGREGPGGGREGAGEGAGPTGIPCVPEPPEAQGRPAGTILSPSHDSFMGDATTGFPLYAGAPVTVRTGRDGKPWMKVQVVIGNEHPNVNPAWDYPAEAYNVRVWLKREIGSGSGQAAGPFHAVWLDPGAPQDNSDRRVCFTNDPRRGLASIWVPLNGLTDPGFQLYAEVVDDDWWFQNNHGFDPVKMILAGPEPQLWAAGDQVMVHLGLPPIANGARPGATPVIQGAAGLFLNRSLIVEEDGDLLNDAEWLLRELLSNVAHTAYRSFIGKDLSAGFLYKSFPEGSRLAYKGGSIEDGPVYFEYDQENVDPATRLWDEVRQGLLGFVDLLTQAEVANVRLGSLSSDIRWEDLLEVDWDATLEQHRQWVEAGMQGDPPGLVTVGDGDAGIGVSADLGKTWIDTRLRLATPVPCPVSFAVRAGANAAGFVQADPSTSSGLRVRGWGGVNDVKLLAVHAPWYTWIRPDCLSSIALASVAIPAVGNSTMLRTLAETLIEGEDGRGGLVQELVDELGIKEVVGSLAIPGAPDPNRPGASRFSPATVVLDRFRDSCAPATCPTDDSLLTTNGVEILADAGLSTEGTRWPNIYRPRTGDPAAVIRSHSTLMNRRRDIGVMVNGEFVNVALNALARLGHLDATSAKFGPIGATIAPMYLNRVAGSAHPVTLALPDVHLDVAGNLFTGSIQFSLGARVDSAGTLSPTLSPTFRVEASVLSCAVDYSNAPITSYAQCGFRSSVPSLVNDLLAALRPVVADVIGRIRVPTPSAVFSFTGRDLRIGVGDGALETKFGHLLITANRRVLPADPGSAVVTLDPDAAPWFTFRAAPDAFPGSGPYEVTWTIQDPYSGWTVDTTACTNQLHCYVDPTRLPAYTDPGGMSSRHHAEVTVTVTRAGVTATATRTYSNG